MKPILKKGLSLAGVCFLAMTLQIISCSKKADEPENQIQGNPGNPRFNLQFTNEQGVDLDLHVITPNGHHVYYRNPSGDGADLDLDCFCTGCPNGPNENIYWTPGTAPRGVYKYWVEYYDNCGAAGASSSYTLRRIENATVKETFTGTLSSKGSKSPVYSFTY